MRIGISALLFNLEEGLTICENSNCINHIEIGIDNLQECEKLCKYKEKINKLNLSIGIHLPMELNTCENISYIRESWKEYIKKLEKNLYGFKISYLNLHLGYVMENRLKRNREKYLNISTQFFDSLDLTSNVLITIENTYSKLGDFCNIGNKLYDFEYIFKNTKNKKVHFCYDTGHYLINEDKYIENLKDKIKVVHLSDNDGVNDIHIGIGRGILSKNHIEKIMKISPEYLVLEINYNHIEESINKLNSIVGEV